MKTWKILLAVLLIVATVGVVLAFCLKPAEAPTGDNTLTVTFYNGDQVYETVTVEAGAKLTLPKAPKAEKGKGFAGWSTIDGDIEEIIDASTFVVNADVKLYAVWADVYTVTINPDNGQPFEVREVFAGTIIEQPADPVKEGFKFVEWRDALQESAFDFSQPIYADVILKAMYGDGAPNRVSDTKWDFSTGIHGSWIGAQGGWNYQINELPAKDMVYQTTEDGYAAWGFTLTDSLDNIPVIDGNNEAGLGMKYIYNEGISVSASKAKLVVIYLKPKYFPIDMATSPNDQFRISVLTSNGGMIYGYGSGSEAWSLRTDAGSKNYIQVDHMEDGWIRVQFKIHELEVWSEDAVIKGMAISIVQRKATPVMDIISVKSIELLDQEEFIDPHEIDYVTDNQWDMTQEESSKDWFGVMSAGVDTNSVKTTIDANGTQFVYANTNKWRGLVLNTAKIDISKCSGIFSATIDVSGMQPTNYRIYIVTDQGGDLYKNSGRDDVSCYYAVTSVTELAEGWTITPNADGTITVSYDLTKLEYWKNGTELLGLSFVTVDATTNGTVVYKSISLTGTVEKHDCETQGHVMKDATCTKPQTCTVCGVTVGEAQGHSFKNGACSVCGAPEFVRTEWDMTDALHAAEWFGYHAKKKNEALTTMVTEDGLVVTYGGAGNGWKGLVLENTAVEISQLTGKLTFTYSSELAITGYRIHILTDLGGNLTANGSAECYIAVDIADVIAGNLADWTQTTNADGSVTVTFDLNSFKYFAKGTELKGLTIVTVTANNVTGSVTYKAIELESNAEKHDCAVSGHIWKDATCTTPKTCLACGATEGKAAGHSWKKATCTAPKTCSVCGLTEGVPAGHNFTDGACTVCGTAEIALSAPIVWDMTDHAYASQWYCAQAYKEIREHITYSEITEEGFKATYLHGNGWKGIILKDVEIDITALSGLLSFTYTEDMDITQYRIHVLTDKGGSLTDNTTGTPSDYYAVVTLDNIAGNSAWTRTENADGSITVTFDLNTLPFYKEGTVLMGMDIVTVTATGTTGTVTYRSVELGAIAEDHNCKNTGHIWKDATCSAPKTCYVCGATKGETVAHTWTDATCTTPKTCTVCGATEGEALGHTLADANCTTPKTCTVCGATVGEALGHTWNNANCTTPKTCTVCGVTEGEVLDHTDIDGDHDHNCDGCGLADVTPHADGDKDLRCDECGAPLCDEGTHTDTDTKDHKCDICGVILSECFDADTDADHNCDHCGKPGITECVPGAAATCTEPQKCTVCGAILNEALGHNWAPATCTKPKTCTICGAMDGEVADHRFEDGVCADCGALNYIPVTKNEWDLSNADDAADWDAYHAMKLNEKLTAEVTTDGLRVTFADPGNGWKGIVLDKAQIDISKLNGMLTFTYSTDMAVSSYRIYLLTDKGGHLLNNSEAGSGYAPANYYVSVKISDIDAGKLTAWTRTVNSDGSITVTFDLTTLPFFAEGTELKGLTIATVTANKTTGAVVYKAVELMAAPSDHDCQEDGHLWADATCTHPKTCSVCGATEGEALGHAWEENVCIKTCSRCGIKEGTEAAHTFENGVCSVCGTNEWDTDCDGVLEILTIGNSFSTDAMEYAWQIAKDLGIEKVVLANIRIGGCTLNMHITNANGDLANYTYYYNDNGTWVSTENYKLSTALQNRSWDYVSLQQASGESGVESTYNEDLTNLVAYIKARSNAKLVWHMTWAYQQNSTHEAFPTYNSDQMTMYNAIVSAVQNKIVTNSDFALIVPNGTAVQNARTSLIGDTLTRDGYHMSKDLGRYLTGLMFIKTVTGLDISDIAYAPDGVSSQYKAIAIESVNNAYAQPFAVTQSEYQGADLSQGYILLQPELYKGAYWNPTHESNYNTLITDSSISDRFFATIRFTREDLPVGSVIVLADGWQYRPDGWVTDELQTGTRETNTTVPYMEITEEWWGNYTIRSFNISKVDQSSLAEMTEEEVRAAFRIYVPEESHNHKYENGLCTLCGAKEPKTSWDLSNAEDAADWDAYHAMKLNEALTTEVTADGLCVTFSGAGNGWKGIVLDNAEIVISKLTGKLTFTYSTDMAVTQYRIYLLTDKGGHLLNNSESGSGYAPANYYVAAKISDIDAGALTAWTKTVNSDGSITVTFDLTTLPFFAEGTELKGLTVCTVTANKTTGTVTYKAIELEAVEEYNCQADGHMWVDATCTAPKTCSACGATEGERLPHGDGNKDHRCDACECSMVVWYMNNSEDANQWYSAQAYTSVKPEVTTSEVTEDGFEVHYMHKNGWKGIILKNVEIDITGLEGMLSFTYTEEMDITHYRIHVLTDKGGSLTDNTSGTPADYYAAVALADIAASASWTRTENEDGSITVTFDLNTLPFFAEGTVLMGMDIVTVTATGTTGTVTYKSIEIR